MLSYHFSDTECMTLLGRVAPKTSYLVNCKETLFYNCMMMARIIDLSVEVESHR